jgi:hypothetical protein
MEGANIRCSIAEEAHANVISALFLKGQGCPNGMGDTAPDYSPAAKVETRVKQVHVTTLALAQTRLSAEYFGHHFFDIYPLSNQVSV